MKEHALLLSNEIWKDIPGCESVYQISNLGRIKSLPRTGNFFKESFKKTFLNNCGYMVIRLYFGRVLKTRLIHKLIAEAFVPKIIGKKYVNHKDGNKLNNSLENLEWCTCSENILHANRTGLKKNFGKGRKLSAEHIANMSKALKGRKPSYGMKGKKMSPEHKAALMAGRLKVKVKGYISPEWQIMQMDINGNFIRYWPTAHEAARQLGLNQSLINAACRGARNKSGGFLWKRVK